MLWFLYTSFSGHFQILFGGVVFFEQYPHARCCFWYVSSTYSNPDGFRCVLSSSCYFLLLRRSSCCGSGWSCGSGCCVSRFPLPFGCPLGLETISGCTCSGIDSILEVVDAGVVWFGISLLKIHWRSAWAAIWQCSGHVAIVWLICCTRPIASCGFGGVYKSWCTLLRLIVSSLFDVQRKLHHLDDGDATEERNVIVAIVFYYRWDSWFHVCMACPKWFEMSL